MKKVIAVLIVLMLALSLSACCLKHDMQPATCTEPSTCSKCGKTEGQPLGHTEVTDAAVEPTCTEPGLTEGSHCSVCGEVLKPQQAIEPLGHNWDPATLSSPRTCRRCGAMAGEPLAPATYLQGAFRASKAVRPIEEQLPEDGGESGTFGAVPEKNSGEPEEHSRYDFQIQAATHGFGDMDQWLADSGMTVRSDISGDQGCFEIELSLDGSEPLSVLITADMDGLCFYLPDIMDHGYSVSYDTFRAQASGLLKDQVPASSISPEQAEQLQSFFQKYAAIVSDVLDMDSLSIAPGTFRLEGLGTEVPGYRIICNPDWKDWSRMLKKLFTAMREDEQLMDVLRQAAGAAEMDDSVRSLMEMYGIEDPDDLTAMVTSLLGTGIENADVLGMSLEGISLHIVSGGGRVHAVKLMYSDDSGIGYESFGEAEGERLDALVQYSIDDAEVLVLNALTQTEETINGQMTFGTPATASLRYDIEESGDGIVFAVSFSSSSFSGFASLDGTGADRRFLLHAEFDEAALEALVERSAGSGTITPPESAITVISDEDDLESALSEIESVLSDTDFGRKAAALSAE